MAAAKMWGKVANKNMEILFSALVLGFMLDRHQRWGGVEYEMHVN